MIDVVEYLKSKDIELKETGSGQGFTQCVFCNEDANKRGRLYFNIDESSEKYGLYHCFLCDTKGGLNSLMRHFGDEPPEDVTEDIIDIMNDAANYYHERLFENVEAYDYLIYERGLTDETIRRARLGYADGGLLAHLVGLGYELEQIKDSGLANRFGNDFLDDKIVIPYLQHGRAVTLRGKEIDAKYLSLPRSNTFLYGVDSIKGEPEVVITAGEFDAIVLQQLGYAACGPPGENQWKIEWNEFFEDAHKVYILFDNDTTGKEAAQKLASKVGPKARVASFPDSESKIDVTKWYVKHNKSVEDFDMLFMRAKGGLLISVDDAYERWLEIEGNPNLVGLRFNIEEIDCHMTHGLLPAQVVVMQAKTNAGKTIMTINTLYRMMLAKPDIRILFMSLEQTRNEWFERAHRINCFYDPDASVLDTMDFWRNNFYMVDKNRVTKTELEACVDQYAYETGGYPDIVAVDYLGYYARSYKGEEYTRITEAIMDLKAIAKERELVFFAPHQVNRQGNFGEEIQADQGRGSGAVEETADFLMSLWASDQKVGVDDSGMKREIHTKILKSRDGGVNTKARLQFAPLTLAMIPLSDPLYPRALRENQYAIAGYDWKSAVGAYRTGDETVQL